MTYPYRGWCEVCDQLPVDPIVKIRESEYRHLLRAKQDAQAEIIGMLRKVEAAERRLNLVESIVESDKNAIKLVMRAEVSGALAFSQWVFNLVAWVRRTTVIKSASEIRFSLLEME
jgi:hypothetical protein